MIWRRIKAKFSPKPATKADCDNLSIALAELNEALLSLERKLKENK